MSEAQQQTDNRWHNPLARGYEPDMLRSRPLVLLVIGFVMLAAVMHLSLWYALIGMSRGARERRELRSAIPQTASAAPADAPALQPSVGHDRSPQQDLHALRTSE